jgi:hypothetical protein
MTASTLKTAIENGMLEDSALVVVSMEGILVNVRSFQIISDGKTEKLVLFLEKE